MKRENANISIRRRTISLLLSILMVVTIIPATIFESSAVISATTPFRLYSLQNGSTWVDYTSDGAIYVPYTNNVNFSGGSPLGHLQYVASTPVGTNDAYNMNYFVAQYEYNGAAIFSSVANAYTGKTYAGGLTPMYAFLCGKSYTNRTGNAFYHAGGTTTISGNTWSTSSGNTTGATATGTLAGQSANATVYQEAGTLNLINLNITNSVRSGFVSVAGNVSFSNISVVSEGYDAVSLEGTTVVGNITNGTYQSNSTSTMDGIYMGNTAKIGNISSGTFTGNQSGLHLDDSSQVGTISGGTFTGTTKGGIYLQTGTIAGITGGTFNGFTKSGGNITNGISGGTFDFTSKPGTYSAISGLLVDGKVARLDSTTSNGKFKVVSNSGLKSGRYMAVPSVASGYTYTVDESFAGVTTYTVSKQATAEHTVTYDANGGTPAPSAATVTAGGSVSLPTELTKTGYSFGGWSTSDNQTSGGMTGNYTPTGDVTLYAVWTPRNYVITYNTNGGDAIAEQTKAYGSSFNLPTPTRSGYTFVDWTVGSTHYAGDASYTVSGAATLTANWKQNFTITYDTCGGSPAQASATVATGTEVTLPTGLTKSGFSFGGWSTSANQTSGGVTKYTVTADVTLYAVWQTVSYSVTYNKNGGSGTAENLTGLAPGATITLPNRQQVTNYTVGVSGQYLSGWSDGTNVYQPGATYTVNSTVTITAQWTTGMLWHYEFNGGTGSVTDEVLPYGMTYYPGSPNSTTPAPTREGYTLAGWGTAGDKDKPYNGVFSYDTSGFTALPTFTFYASWWINSYEMSYNVNGGDGSVSSATWEYNSTHNLPGAPSRTGYNFAGWKASSNDQVYGAGASFTVPAGDVSFVAQWTIKTFTVTYNANGGTGVPAQGSGNYNTTYTVAFSPEPVKDGYEFIGWSTDSGATAATYTAAGSKTITLTSDVTLYAVYKESVRYTVSFDLKGGTDSASAFATAGRVIPGASYAIPTGTLTKTGYNFGGWATSDGGAVAYQNGSTIASVSSSMILYAVWIPKTYTVSYNAGDGTGNVPATNSSVVYGSSYTVSFEQLPTKAHYTFAGWATTSGGAAAYTVSGNKTFTMPADNVTLYAIFTENAKYTITYSANGGEGEPASDTQYAGETMTISATVPTKAGSDFMGWATSSDTLTATYHAGDTPSFTADTILYAVWAETFTVTGFSNITNTYVGADISDLDLTGVKAIYHYGAITRNVTSFLTYSLDADHIDEDGKLKDVASKVATLTLSYSDGTNTYTKTAPITYDYINLTYDGKTLGSQTMAERFDEVFAHYNNLTKNGRFPWKFNPAGGKNNSDTSTNKGTSFADFVVTNLYNGHGINYDLSTVGQVVGNSILTQGDSFYDWFMVRDVITLSELVGSNTGDAAAEAVMNWVINSARFEAGSNYINTGTIIRLGTTDYSWWVLRKLDGDGIEFWGSDAAGNVSRQWYSWTDMVNMKDDPATNLIQISRTGAYAMGDDLPWSQFISTDTTFTPKVGNVTFRYTAEDGKTGVLGISDVSSSEYHPAAVPSTDMPGYKFIGWYTDSACTTICKKVVDGYYQADYTTAHETVYAKYVKLYAPGSGQFTILNPRAQGKKLDANNQNGSVRLVMAVDDLNYYRVGFLITTNASLATKAQMTVDFNTTTYSVTSHTAGVVSSAPTDSSRQTVWSSIVFSTGTGNQTLTSKAMNPAANYIYTFSINGITSTTINKDIYVRAFHVTRDGTVHYDDKIECYNLADLYN